MFNPVSPRFPSLLISYTSFPSPHISTWWQVNPVLVMDKYFKYVWITVHGYQSKFPTIQMFFSFFSLQLNFEIDTLLLSHLFMFLMFIVIFMAQHDSILILGIGETWTKIRVINSAWHLCLHFCRGQELPSTLIFMRPLES